MKENNIDKRSKKGSNPSLERRDGKNKPNYKNIETCEISSDELERILKDLSCTRYHAVPSIFYIGALLDGELVGIVSFGYEVYPGRVIRDLFPSLGKEEYCAIGRIALTEEMPAEAESYILDAAINHIRKSDPQFKLLLAYGDELLEHPGTVFQTLQFWYGGYNWSEFPLHESGTPLTMEMSDKVGTKVSYFKYEDIGVHHYNSKIYIYGKFLCGDDEKSRLINESPYDWCHEYPNADDMMYMLMNDEWCHEYPSAEEMTYKLMNDEGAIETEKPYYDPGDLVLRLKDGMKLEDYKEI